MKHFSILTFAGIVLLAQIAFAQKNNDEKEILSLLNRQTADWNAGKIDAFMEGYWKSDSLSFMGASGVTYGWQNTLNNYKKRYPDLATMGQLKFDIVRMNLLDQNAYYIIGKWALTRPEKGNIGGYFSLVFRKIKGKWLIVSDHTS